MSVSVAFEEARAEGRAALVGFTIAELVPSELASQHLPTSGGTVVLSDGDAALYRSGPSLQNDDHVVRARMDVGGRSWLIAARPIVAGPGGTPAAVLMVSMVLALGMLLTGRALHEVESVATTRALDREEDLSTIAGLSPLLQQSLELGEVLPALAARLT